MLKRLILGSAAALVTSAGANAAPQILAPAAAPGASVQPYVRVNAPTVVLRHLRLIDGTGAAALSDRTIVVAGGKIVAVGGPELAYSASVEVLDMTGRAVMPGLVGLHDHMYYIARPNMDATGHSEAPLMVP